MGDELRLLRQQGAVPVLIELHEYLLKIREEVLPKGPAAQAVSYALKNWQALTRYCQDGDLPIDNNLCTAVSGSADIMPPPGLCRVLCHHAVFAGGSLAWEARLSA